MSDYLLENIVCGNHAYKIVWKPVHGEELRLSKQGSPRHKHAVSVMKACRQCVRYAGASMASMAREGGRRTPLPSPLTCFSGGDKKLESKSRITSYSIRRQYSLRVQSGHFTIVALTYPLVYIRLVCD